MQVTEQRIQLIPLIAPYRLPRWTLLTPGSVHSGELLIPPQQRPLCPELPFGESTLLSAPVPVPEQKVSERSGKQMGQMKSVH